MKNILILLSSYNGEKYIKEQIDSILQQIGVQTKILVRDDGSTDNTIEILEKYQEKGFLSLVKGDNVGWAQSFMELVKIAPYSEYYAFCDQDDVWLPEKLKTAIESIECSNRKRNLYFSNLNSWKNGKIIGKVKDLMYFDKYTALVRCQSYGCTMVWDDSFMSVVQSSHPSYFHAHDWWFYLSGIYLGNIIYDPNAYILYRQHENNQVGSKKTQKEIWTRRLREMKTLFNDNHREMQAKEFLNCFDGMINETDKKIIRLVADYKNSPINRVKLLFNKKITMGKLLNTIFLKFRIIIGHI